MLRALAAALCLVSTTVVAAQDETAVPNFFVSPITTRLQRDVVSSTADVYAAVHCNALQPDGEGGFTLPDQDAFAAALKAAARHGPHLRLNLWYHLPPDTDRAHQGQVRMQLTEFAKSVGYQRVDAAETSTSSDWAWQVGPAIASVEAADATESPVGDDLIRVYPVRTTLSRFVRGDADCIVEVFDPIDADAARRWPELRASIAEHVRSLGLNDPSKLVFDFMSTDSGRELAESMFDYEDLPRFSPDAPPAFVEERLKRFADEHPPSPAMELAKELGFETIGWRHSAGLGAPDLLIGNDVPDFTLERLGGGEITLRESIKGRPALITFWGLACGPCRVEAPHLSRLYDEYRERGFQVVAVNAYNDPAEAVADYVAGESLSYPVALQGRSVAVELYRVGAYPTTFWVDASGTVVDYDIGFGSPERLEGQVQQAVGAGE